MAWHIPVGFLCDEGQGCLTGMRQQRSLEQEVGVGPHRPGHVLGPDICALGIPCTERHNAYDNDEGRLPPQHGAELGAGQSRVKLR